MPLTYNWRIVSRDASRDPTMWDLGIEVMDGTGRQVQMKLTVQIAQDTDRATVVEAISTQVSQAIARDVGTTAALLDRMIVDATLVPLEP